MAAMARARRKPPPIPRRIKPLTWRKPVFVWTPLALAAALGWPAFLLDSDAGLAPAILIVGAAAFAAALTTLGASWLLQNPPRTRRVVLLHLVFAGGIAALAAPFVWQIVLRNVAGADGSNIVLPDETPWALAPFALLIGLPVALFSGLVFAFVALSKPAREH